MNYNEYITIRAGLTQVALLAPATGPTIKKGPMDIKKSYRLTGCKQKLFYIRAGLTPMALLAPATGPHYQKGPHGPNKSYRLTECKQKLFYVRGIQDSIGRNNI